MTLQELIEELQQLAELTPPDTVVHLAIQPQWPFAHKIDMVALVDPNDADDDEGPVNTEGMRPVVYIAEAGQAGYLPGAACAALNW